MKLPVVKRIAVVLCLTVAVTTLQAQTKIPTWVKKEPIRKDSYIGIAKAAKPNPMDTIPYNPFYKEDTQRTALWKIASQMPWNVDVKSSLYSKLLEKGLYKASLNEVLLREIQQYKYQYRYWFGQDEDIANRLGTTRHSIGVGFAW